MKTGKSISQLAAEIMRQQETKKDFLADTRQLVMEKDGANMMIKGIGQFMLNHIAQDQLCNQLAIPRKYYELMRNTAPQLLAENVNHWLTNTPDTRMVRTLDGNIRAFLSSKYRAMDNFDLAASFLPILGEMELEVVSSELTDSKLYIKAVFPKIQREVKKGDIVQSGIMITNSEVGQGSLSVQPLVYRLICLNGAIINDARMSKRHVGRRLNDGDSENPYEIYQDDTKKADDKALWLKVRDTVASTISEVTFDKYVRKFVESTEIKMDGDIQKAVEVVSEKVGLMETEKAAVLRHLIEGGDLSSYGLSNAITRTSNDLDDYDRSTDLQVIGGQIIDLGADAWKAAA